MMVKLYKRSRSSVRYWEAWKADWFVVVHEGLLGDIGKKRIVFPTEGQTPESLIEDLAARPLKKGYDVLPDEEHQLVIVQYQTKGWGSTEDLERRHKIEDYFNECLGWTGNGLCDGGDIGSGTINVFNYVVDVGIATQTILSTLRKHRLLKGAVLAVRENEVYRVLYPAKYKKTFSL